MTEFIDQLKAAALRLWDRVANEPALVVSFLGSLGLLIGEDLSDVASFLESAIVLLSGGVLRQFVTPMRKLRVLVPETAAELDGDA